MNIDKFKIFEGSSWSIKEFESLWDRHDEFKRLVFEYCAYNNIFHNLSLPVDRYYRYIFDFSVSLIGELDVEYILIVSSRIVDDQRYMFTKKDMNDLLLYMSDPEAYKSAKKYNL